MKRKLSILFRILLALSFCVAATETSAQQNSPFEDFLDSKREGLFAGGGIAYGSTRFSASVSKDELNERYQNIPRSLSGGLQWRLGYATSEHLAFYVTSFATNLDPSLGVLMYSEKYQGYYLNALVGYSSYGYEGPLPSLHVDDERPSFSTWHLGAGVGYEFRPHFMIEAMAGYSRFTLPDSYVSDYIRDSYWWRETYEAFHLKRITLFVSVNYVFY